MVAKVRVKKGRTGALKTSKTTLYLYSSQIEIKHPNSIMESYYVTFPSEYRWQRRRKWGPIIWNLHAGKHNHQINIRLIIFLRTKKLYTFHNSAKRGRIWCQQQLMYQLQKICFTGDSRYFIPGWNSRCINLPGRELMLRYKDRKILIFSDCQVVIKALASINLTQSWYGRQNKITLQQIGVAIKGQILWQNRVRLTKSLMGPHPILV